MPATPAKLNSGLFARTLLTIKTCGTITTPASWRRRGRCPYGYRRYLTSSSAGADDQALRECGCR